jgi:hypothetical protein
VPCRGGGRGFESRRPLQEPHPCLAIRRSPASCRPEPGHGSQPGLALPLVEHRRLFPRSMSEDELLDPSRGLRGDPSSSAVVGVSLDRAGRGTQEQSKLIPCAVPLVQPRQQRPDLLDGDPPLGPVAAAAPDENSGLVSRSERVRPSSYPSHRDDRSHRSRRMFAAAAVARAVRSASRRAGSKRWVIEGPPCLRPGDLGCVLVR